MSSLTISFTFKDPVTIRGYAVKSSDGDLKNCPSRWVLKGKPEDQEAMIEIDKVKPGEDRVFSFPWQNNIMFLPTGAFTSKTFNLFI